MRVRVQTDCSGPSPVVSSAAAACDVNKIVARARKTGEWPIPTRTPEYLDVSEIGDYRESLEKIRHGERLFAALPSDIRTRFNNDLGELVVFLGNPANAQEAIKLGLAKAPEKGSVVPVEAPKEPPK